MTHWSKQASWSLFALVLGFGLAVPAVARAAQRQRPGGQGAGPAALQERFQKAREATLEIATEPQKPKVEAIFAKAMEKLQAIRQDIEANPDQRAQIGQRLMASMRDLRTQLDELFTPEQREKLKQKLEEIFPMLARMGGAAPGQILQHLRQHMGELNLTDEQKQKLQTLQADLRDEMQKLRDELQADRQAAAPKLRQFMQDVQQKIKDILSAEQFKQLEGLMKADGASVPAAKKSEPVKPAAAR
jgi:DNA repair ATPase RecN